MAIVPDASFISGLLAAPAPLTSVMPPAVVLMLCVLAGIGTILLLPSRLGVSLRFIGALLMLAAIMLVGGWLIGASADESGRSAVYFWIFSGIALVGAYRVVTHPRPVYSALYFVLTVFASAGLFILLWAEFMAAALVLIYAGAILITYVFVIMLAAQARTAGSAVRHLSDYDAVSREPILAATVGFALMGVLLFVIFDKGQTIASHDAAAQQKLENHLVPDIGSTQRLGTYLFEHQAVNLELAGLILTVAMVGAIVIARKQIIVADPVPGGATAQVTAPMTPITDDPHSIPVYGTDNPRQKAYPET